jgi:hypothetical protein
MKFLAEIKSKI